MSSHSSRPPIIAALIHTATTYTKEHLWKYLVDFEGDHSGHSLVREVHIVFSKSIPTDVLVLTQQPFVTERWREGPNPGHLEIIVYYKVLFSGTFYLTLWVRN